MSRGNTATGVLVTLALLGTITVTATVITPRYLQATNAPPETIEARSPEHQQIIEMIGDLLGGSEAILALHGRGHGPYVEAVIWIEDRSNGGVIDAGELAVLSHSQVMQTISLFLAAPAPDPILPAAPSHRPAPPVGPYDEAFCQAWRTRADVTRRVIAAGISDMHLALLPTRPDGPTHLRVGLTWAADSADGPDDASILVEVAMRRDGAPP